MEGAKALAELVRLNQQFGRNTIELSEATNARTATLLLAVVLGGLAILIAVSFSLTRNCNNAINILHREATRLTEAALSGQLSVRANVASIPAEFRGVVQGVNDTLDAVVNPLHRASEHRRGRNEQGGTVCGSERRAVIERI